MQPKTRIFVFGSNMAGRHGRGAALVARNEYGATYGNGLGRTGNAYAIATKDMGLKRVPLAFVEMQVSQFREYARSRLDLEFFVTRIGCGLAGFTDEQIAPLFRDMPYNCLLPARWLQYIPGERSRAAHHHWDDDQEEEKSA